MSDLIRAMASDLLHEDAVDDELNDLLMQDLLGLELPQSRGPLMETKWGGFAHGAAPLDVSWPSHAGESWDASAAKFIRKALPKGGKVTIDRGRLAGLAHALEHGDIKAAKRFYDKLPKAVQDKYVTVAAREKLSGRKQEDRPLREGVSETIGKQIKHGMSMLDYLSLGIKNRFSFKADQEFIGVKAKGPGLQMDVRGHWKGRVIIRLAASDTYTIVFGRVRASKWKIDKTVDGIYADQLGEVIKDNVLGNGIRK